MAIKTTKKTGAGPAGRAKRVAAAEGEAVEGAEDTGTAGPVLRLKGLLDAVVAATGSKKQEVKTIVEAALLQIGDALQRGENLNLPGLGKARVVRPQAADGSAAMTVKLRRPVPGEAGKEAVAEPADQG